MNHHVHIIYYIIFLKKNKNFTYTIPQKNQQQFVPIERGDTVRDLGAIFDKKLNFKEHTHCKIWPTKWSE